MDYLKPDVWLAVEERDFAQYLVDGHFEVSSPVGLRRYFHQSEVGQSREDFTHSFVFRTPGARFFVFKPMFSKAAFETNMLNLLKGGSAWTCIHLV